MLSGNTMYFLFAYVSHKGSPTGKRQMSALSNPSLLSSLLQAALLQLWKTPFDCSQFASLALLSQESFLRRIIWKGKERKMFSEGAEKGLFILRALRAKGTAHFRAHHGPYFRCMSHVLPQQHRSRRQSKHGRKRESESA